MFSCKFCKISNKTFSYRTPPVAASGSSNMFLIKWTKIMANFVHARVLLFLWDIRSFLTYMTPYLQIGKRQPSKKLSKKRCFLKSENSQKYACVGVSFLIKSILLNKRLRHRCFPMNFGKFLRTPILKNICERLLLHTLGFFYKLGWAIAKQLPGLNPLSLRNNKNYRLKKSGIFPL